MTEPKSFHSLEIRFDLRTQQKVKKLFKLVSKHFSHRESGEWFQYDKEEMVSLFGDYFSYQHHSFGNFLNRDIDSETWLDIAVLKVNNEYYDQANILLFYGGELGGVNELGYVVLNDSIAYFPVCKNVVDEKDLVLAIRNELAFLSFAASIKTDLSCHFTMVQKAFDLLKEKKKAEDIVRELLSDNLQKKSYDLDNDDADYDEDDEEDDAIVFSDNWECDEHGTYDSHHILIQTPLESEVKYRVLINPDGEGWVIGVYSTHYSEMVPLEIDQGNRERLTFSTAQEAMDYVDDDLEKGKFRPVNTK